MHEGTLVAISKIHCIERLNRGLCPECPKGVKGRIVPGCSLCRCCLLYSSWRVKQCRRRRVAAGFCRMCCLRPFVAGKRHCEECLRKEVERSAERRKAKGARASVD